MSNNLIRSSVNRGLFEHICVHALTNHCSRYLEPKYLQKSIGTQLQLAVLNYTRGINLLA